MNVLKLAATGGVLAAPSNAWDIAYIGSNPNLAWNVSKCVLAKSFSVSGQETSPQDIFFKPDGTKMYVIGATGDDVNEYSLSTAWDVSSASYVQVFSVAAKETNPGGLFFKDDGTKMYVTGTVSDSVHEYALSTAWNISTASFSTSFSVSGQETIPLGLSFKSDGTKMYVIGQGNKTVYEYSLSTAWDVSTASYVQGFSTNAQDTAPGGLYFKPDGTKMYVVGTTNDAIYEYSLSTAWNVSTASYVQNFSVANQDNTPSGVFFSTDGTNMYLIGSAMDTVYQYYLANTFSVASQETTPQGLFFKPDGTKMYVCGATGDDVNEYSLSTAWDVSTASYVQIFSVASQETAPSSVFFKPDGTKMYVMGTAGDDVNEYTLSTAWNISTASYVQVSGNVQDGTPNGLFFKPDGTKMYVVGGTADEVNEFTLSTAWDVSTATYVQNLLIGSTEPSPFGIFFQPDGLTMYVSGTTGAISQFSLSTAWNISTASFVKKNSLLINGLRNIFFKDTGDVLYTVELTDFDRVTEFYIN